MTGGRVVILGRTGRNFAAGMSGGLAYVLDENGKLGRRCNPDAVDLEPLRDEDQEIVRGLLERHVHHTGSALALRLLAQWPISLTKFVKAIPRDYKRALEAAQPQVAATVVQFPLLKVANG